MINNPTTLSFLEVNNRYESIIVCDVEKWERSAITTNERNIKQESSCCKQPKPTEDFTEVELKDTNSLFFGYRNEDGSIEHFILK